MDGPISHHSWDGNLRTIELDGEPWFVASDICRILGLDTYAGVGRHLVRLGADEKRLACRTEPTARHSRNRPLILTEGAFGWRSGEVHTTIITESGLYKLIMRSDKDTARPFQDWVTR